MDEEIIEEFNERFATVEDALKYIADSQAKSEFAFRRALAENNRAAAEHNAEHNRAVAENKRAVAEHNKDVSEIRRLQAETQRHLNHITKVLRFNIEEYKFQEDKITEAGEILNRKRNK